MGATSTGSYAAISGAGGTISVTGWQPPPDTVKTVTCTPGTLVTPGNAACTVTLTGAAPSGGLSVALADPPVVSVPASVAVASGSSTANFTASAGSVTTAQSAPITASLNGSSQSFTLNLQPPGTTAGLVAAYSFSEGSGSTVADASGNGNTGTIANAAWTTAGKYGSALVFNGSSAMVTINDSASLHLSNAMTLEAWVNPSATSTLWTDVVYKANDAFYLSATSTSNSAPGAGGTFGGANANTYGLAALPLNAWTHLAVTYNGNSLLLYVNGVLVSSKGQTGTLLSSTNPLQIGGDSLFGQYFTGTIDEVRVYNAALTQAQIQSDMNTPLGSSGNTNTTPTVKSLSCSPSTVASGSSSTCTVTLSQTAPTGGSGVAISDNSSALTTPTSLTVPAGASSATFAAAAGSVTANTSVTVTASLGSSSATASLTISAPVAGTISKLACSPTSISSGSSSACTVTLSQAAPSGGSTVSISDNSSALTTPAAVTVGAGNSTATFNAAAGSCTSNTSVTVTASMGGSSATASITVQPTSASLSGPVAAYAFDEATGSTTADASGNGNTGQIHGATWSTLAKYGNALSFDGTSSYVDLGAGSAFQNTGSMSWTAWVYATGNPPDDGQIVALSTDNSGWQLKTTPDTGVRTFGVAVSPNGTSHTQRYSKTVLSLNTWYHVAGVYNAAAQTLDIYVNGVLDDGVATGTVPAAQVIPAGVNASVGQRSGGYLFNGVIDNLRIYNRALSAADVQTDMNTPVGSSGSSSGSTNTAAAVTSLQCSPATIVSGSPSTCTVTLSQAAPTGGSSVPLSDNSSPALTIPASVTVPAGALTATFTATGGVVASNTSVTITATLNGSSTTGSVTIQAPLSTPGLVAAYSFKEGAGSTVHDSSGNNNTGTISGATWTASGMYGSALVFNGTNALVTINDSAPLHLTNAMTLEAWVNPSTVTKAWRDVVYKGNDAYYLSATSTSKSLPALGGTFGNKNANTYGSAALPTNTWTHLAATYDGQYMRLYVNGVLVSSKTQTGTLLSSTNPLEIGGDSIFGQFFAGTIDEVRVYNTALTQVQIQTDMNTPVQ
jgi:hypothetical protein